jgi:hypothetical protein
MHLAHIVSINFLAMVNVLFGMHSIPHVHVGTLFMAFVSFETRLTLVMVYIFVEMHLSSTMAYIFIIMHFITNF